MIRAYRGIVPKIAASCLHRSQRTSDRRCGDRRTVQRVAQRHDPRRRELHPHRRRDQRIQDNSVIHVEHDRSYPDYHREPRHRWPFGHAARLRDRGRVPDRHRRDRVERRAGRQRIGHRRRRAGAGRDADSAGQPGDGRSGERSSREVTPEEQERFRENAQNYVRYRQIYREEPS